MWDDRLGYGYLPAEPIEYDTGYINHYRDLSGTKSGVRIQEFRIKWVLDHAGRGISLLDYGSGDLTFVIMARATHWPEAHGHDICDDEGVRRALDDLGFGSLRRHHAVCFWDSLEHLPNPAAALRLADAWAFITVPIMPYSLSPARLHEWKHYKPGEHFWYFTKLGLCELMYDHGFVLVNSTTEECQYGREDVATFAFIRKEIK